jgi:hypothetical protein
MVAEAALDPFPRPLEGLVVDHDRIAADQVGGGQAELPQLGAARLALVEVGLDERSFAVVGHGAQRMCGEHRLARVRIVHCPYYEGCAGL